MKKKKLELNNLTLVQADNGKSIVIIDKGTLRQKIQDFVTDNHFIEIKLDPTDKFQKILRKVLINVIT